MPVTDDWAALSLAESGVLEVKVLLLTTPPKPATAVVVELRPLELISSPVDDVSTVVCWPPEGNLELVLGNDVKSPVLDAVPGDVKSPLLDAVPVDVESSVFDAVPCNIVEGPLPSCDPVAVTDWLPEPPCGVWPAPTAIEDSDDVPLFESTLMAPMRLLVDSCDVELCIAETDPLVPPMRLLVDSGNVEVCVLEADPLELVPVVMLPCKLLGFEEDVGSPPLDVPLSADPLVPILPTLVSWLDEVLIVDDAP